MMLLSDISTKGYDSFENAGYRVPKYNRKKMVTKTMESPFWIHFGAGNIFRAFQANVIEQLAICRESLRKTSCSLEKAERFSESRTRDSATLPITEKGYQLCQPNGSYRKDVMADIISGPDHTISYMGKVVSLLHTRYLAGKKPIALVSMDNCSHNGSKLFDAVFTYASEWLKRGLVDSGFVTYIKNPDSVSFPWTMTRYSHSSALT